MRKNAVVIKPTAIDNKARGCTQKKNYTKREALEAARRSARRGVAKQMGVYECPYGGHWHITHTVTLAR